MFTQLNLFKRCANALATVIALSLVCADTTLAQTFPAKPLRFVVPFAPGGQSDIVARVIAQRLNEFWGQAVVVENRPGAASTIGADAVAKAPADGYTLLLAAAPFVITQYAYPKLPYDSRRDFAPVSLVMATPLVMVVNATGPMQSLADLTTAARARPGALMFGSAGNGSLPHLVLELFNQRANVALSHVPYKGGGPAVLDTVAGHVTGVFASPGEVNQHLLSGKLRAIGVTAAARLVEMPNVPTLAESGLNGFDAVGWFGVVMRSGTSPEIVQRVASDIARALQAPEVRQKLASPGATLVGDSPQSFARFLAAEHEKWAITVKAAGVKVE